MFEVGKMTDSLPRRLTVVRFPSGAWSYGGSPSSPEYRECEIYLVACPSDEWFDPIKYVRKAQAWRSKNKSKVEK